ncbi:ABC transporter ATP-binding protein [Kribbella sancticallisti]
MVADQALSGLCVVAVIGTVFGLASAQVVAGRSTPEDLATTISALTALTFAFSLVGQEFFDILGGMPAALAGQELLRRTSLAVANGVSDLGHAPGTVRIQDVHYTYPGARRPALDGVSFTIGPGETVAVVGHNGAGKTTLIKLLTGLLQPDHGEITVNGTRISDLGLPVWWQHLSVVPQRPVRYPLSLRFNLDPQLAMATTDEAPGIEEIVQRLPKGRDTILSGSQPGGVNLSGGEWQLVTLSRAMHAVRAGAQFLILDEPTANMDVRTEERTLTWLSRQGKDCSVVLISHRLSTVLSADRIIMLADGKVAESGSHQELLLAAGAYATLFADTAADAFEEHR